MDWNSVLEKRIKSRRQILFSKDDEEIKSLMLLIDEVSKQTAVRWALDYAEGAVKMLEQHYPDDIRPREALELSKKWAAGEVKMWAVRPAILSCHAMAKGLENLSDIARCHAVGQACSVMHAKGHAIGFPIYDLTALIREEGTENCSEIISERIKEYTTGLLYLKSMEEKENAGL